MVRDLSKADHIVSCNLKHFFKLKAMFIEDSSISGIVRIAKRRTKDVGRQMRIHPLSRRGALCETDPALRFLRVDPEVEVVDFEKTLRKRRHRRWEVPLPLT